MAMTSMATGDDAPTNSPYGYGLSICLNGEQCEALGVLGPIKPGTKLGLTAIAMVVCASEELEGDDADGETDVRLTLQITDLDINQGVDSGKTATMLYGA